MAERQRALEPSMASRRVFRPSLRPVLRRVLRRTLPVAWALLLSMTGPVLAAEWGLVTLLEEIARANPTQARFVERRFVQALDTPVDTQGELAFIRPARLEKRVLKPRAETLILDGDELSIERNGQRRSFSLRQMPEAGALVESVRATLAGDRATLERLFTARLEGPSTQWLLVLEPKEVDARRILRQVRMSGIGGRVDLIEIDQSNGDRSVMRVLH